jgi:hypothetical protein
MPGDAEARRDLLAIGFTSSGGSYCVETGGERQPDDAAVSIADDE